MLKLRKRISASTWNGLSSVILWGAVLIKAPWELPPVVAVDEGIVMVILSSVPCTMSPLVKVIVTSKPFLPVRMKSDRVP